eukprot:CAMPEP_0183331012 /NCGR_PEP_ID=MMETSP0164_2-20130417/430_1 /TAXON_ID=221442 /ORGANISM="Coccolithus pelagicus ssp braarudi, Strain PLY182g" /LENGTH=120 /DNA_ID=CAMNT_0025499367 /DNA_START=216 /DNA_END=578 /DNA_ORIENTATION=+
MTRAPEHLRHRRLHWPDDGLSSFLRSHHLKLGTNIFTRNIRVVMLHVMLHTSSNTLGTYNIEDSSFEHRDQRGLSSVDQTISSPQADRHAGIVDAVGKPLAADDRPRNIGSSSEESGHRS